MRWQGKKLGDKRLRTRFLLIPKKINGEWRWWETATWQQEYKRDNGAHDSWWSIHWVTGRYSQ